MRQSFYTEDLGNCGYGKVYFSAIKIQLGAKLVALSIGNRPTFEEFSLCMFVI